MDNRYPSKRILALHVSRFWHRKWAKLHLRLLENQRREILQRGRFRTVFRNNNNWDFNFHNRHYNFCRPISRIRRPLRQQLCRSREIRIQGRKNWLQNGLDVQLQRLRFKMGETELLRFQAQRFRSESGWRRGKILQRTKTNSLLITVFQFP